MPLHAWWFGEDQARYIITVADATSVQEIIKRHHTAGNSLGSLGETGGDAIVIGDEGSVSLSQLDAQFEGWLPTYMGGAAA